MKDYSNYVTIEIKLPRHIAEWLQKFSKELAKTPDQVLAYILTYYYEAWRIGYEAGLRSSTVIHEENQQIGNVVHVDSVFTSGILNDIFNEYITKNKYKAKFKWIIRRFISWITERSYHLDPEELKSAVKEFIDEYRKHKEVNKKTISVYKSALKDFIEYLCLRLKQKDKDIEKKTETANKT